MVSQESGSSQESVLFEPGRGHASSVEAQITVALEEYAKLRRFGRAPRRAEFLARHGAIAVALAECLDGLELVENAASHFVRALMENQHRAPGSLLRDESTHDFPAEAAGSIRHGLEVADAVSIAE
jgi:hypothetical protein